MNRLLRENVADGNLGLECLPFTEEQVDALKESGYIKSRGET